MRYVIPILGLLLLIFVHELGHFTAAKRTGMRALRFYIGFPPPIVRRKVGDTEYGVGLIPLGGSVKIPGMLRPEPSDLWAVEDLLDRSERLPQERASEIGVAHDHIARLFAAGRMDEAAVEARQLIELIDGTEEIGATDRRRVRKSLERFIEATDPRGYWRSSRRSRLITIGAGPFANILTSFVLLTVLAVTGLPQPLYATPTVAGIEKGLPADRAGLRVGDRIVAVDGRPVRTVTYNGHRVGDFAQVRALIGSS